MAEQAPINTAPAFRDSTKAYCPKCGRHAFLVRSPVPPLPASIVGPETMYSGICNCGAGITLAVTANHFEACHG